MTMQGEEGPLSRPSLRPSMMLRVPVEAGFFERLARRALGLVGHVGRVSDMFVGAVRAGFRRPFEGKAILTQLESLGVASVGIVATDPHVVQRQRCVNIAAFAVVFTSLLHLIVISIHDFHGMLPVNLYNALYICGALMVPPALAVNRVLAALVSAGRFWVALVAWKATKLLLLPASVTVVRLVSAIVPLLLTSKVIRSSSPGTMLSVCTPARFTRPPLLAVIVWLHWPNGAPNWTDCTVGSWI